MYFIFYGFETVYYLCKELDLRCCSVPGITLFRFLQVVSGTNSFIISLITLVFFGTRKSNTSIVALLSAIFKF